MSEGTSAGEYCFSVRVLITALTLLATVCELTGKSLRVDGLSRVSNYAEQSVDKVVQ